ncbi:hypothetical protein OGAPHI_005286 [Ogataea philodendri]|uniref:Uncharacterized protein n=1 Tax=Ogataea philodendri TaxID=1378263 RepID=A0A9P8P1M8_9ASCO|nr:uncharacterized protein OGAPHI_005286 [Ogataea philodendri]KAH3663883.1 hypothetical protein OGAPHI_005286 [Ogataea philodendri]
MFEHCVKSRILSLSKHNWAPVLDSKHSYVMFEFLEILNSFKNSSVENRLCKDSFVTFSQPCRSISTRFGHRLTSSLTTSSSTLLQSLNLTRFNSGQL